MGLTEKNESMFGGKEKRYKDTWKVKNTVKG